MLSRLFRPPIPAILARFQGVFVHHIYEELDGLNSARSFLIRERDDGVYLQHSLCSARTAQPRQTCAELVQSCVRDMHSVLLRCTALAFWYKPESSHLRLCPCKKDENGSVIESTVNGEKTTVACPHGIKISNTKYMAAFSAFIFCWDASCATEGALRAFRRLLSSRRAHRIKRSPASMWTC
eukprot:5281816-Pleurochrysis_carterae.AAC.3